MLPVKVVLGTTVARSPDTLCSSLGAELQGMLDTALLPLRMLEDYLCSWLARATILLEFADVSDGVRRTGG